MNQGGVHRFPTRLVAAAAIAWGLLVWANWLPGNPVSAAKVGRALAAFARIDPRLALAASGVHLLRLLELALLAAAAAGAGGSLVRWLAPFRIRGRGLFSLGVGSGAIALATLGAGFDGLLGRGPAWVLVAAAAVAGVRRLEVPRWGWAFAGGCWPLSVALAGALLIALLGSLAPEVSFDALAHHLAHPAVWAADRRVHGLPYHFLSLYPAILEMQYLVAILIDGPALAKLVHFGFGLLTIGALLAWARRVVPDPWALAAAAGFALLPYVQTVFMWAYVDLGAAAYLTLAGLGVSAAGPVPAALTGVLCGLCAGTKAAGAFSVILMAGVLLGRGASRREWAAFAAAAFLTAVPWGIRNWALSGNPFAPFASGIIPTLWWGPDNQARYVRELGSYSAGHAPAGGVFAVLAQPWLSSVRNYGVLDQSAGMGAWFVWLIPMLALLGAGEARLPAALSLGFFALWYLVPGQVRYLLPVWPAASIAAAEALRSLCARGGAGLVPAWASAGLLALAAAAGVQREHYVINPLPVVFGSETRDAYYARGLPGTRYTVRAVDWLRAHEANRRLLVVSHYGLNLLWGPRAIAQSVFDTPAIERAARESAGPGRIAAAFRQLGSPWLLYSTFGGFTMQAVYGMYHFDEGSAARWRAFWTARGVRLANIDDRYQVWDLGRSPTGRTTAGILPGLDEQWLGETDWEVSYAERTGNLAGVIPGAEAAYRKVAAERRDAAAWERLGSLYLRSGRRAEAERALREAAKLGRDTSVLHDALGVLCAQNGRMAEAAREFRRSLAAEPGLLDARRNLAVLLWSIGDRNAALGVVREGLIIDPEAGELRELVARWTGSTGGMP